MKLIPELNEQLRKLEDWKSAGIGKQIGTIRVDARQMEQLRHEINCEGFTLTVNEPSKRGGTNLGLYPLGHFVTGAVACFLTNMAKAAILMNLKLDTMEITARGHYDRGPARTFTDFIYDVRLTGEETIENVTKLMYEAEERCFVHQTLKKALSLTSNMFLNGAQVATHTLGPK
jgi:uncharacterized OsmC-like protein